MSQPFDPQTPIPGPPDPWSGASLPADRDGPPYFMTEMIEAEPAFAERCLTRLATDGSADRLASELRVAAASGAPVVVVGCGTSEHGALGATEILREAWRQAGLPGVGPVSAQAFEAALDPQAGGLCIAVSHDGGTWATTRALATARLAGARTALITVSGQAPGAAGVDVVVETVERDTSYCHTVGYLSPLLAAVAAGARLTGQAVDGATVRELLRAGIRAATDEATVGVGSALGSTSGSALGSGSGSGAAAEIARQLADSRTILVIASGSDRPAARELVLKIEEGAWIPAAMRDLETFLHGHLPSTDASTGLIVILTERAARVDRVARTRQALEAAAVVGLRTAAILAEGVSADLGPELTPVGRIVVPDAPSLPGAVAALLSSATPLQLIAERLARTRGTNPDLMRRSDQRYREAAARVEG